MKEEMAVKMRGELISGTITLNNKGAYTFSSSFFPKAPMDVDSLSNLRQEIDIILNKVSELNKTTSKPKEELTSSFTYNGDVTGADVPWWVVREYSNGTLYFDKEKLYCKGPYGTSVVNKGDKLVKSGSYITVKEVEKDFLHREYIYNGELFPCFPEFNGKAPTWVEEALDKGILYYKGDKLYLYASLVEKGAKLVNTKHGIMLSGTSSLESGLYTYTGSLVKIPKWIAEAWNNGTLYEKGGQLYCKEVPVNIGDVLLKRDSGIQVGSRIGGKPHG